MITMADLLSRNTTFLMKNQQNYNGMLWCYLEMDKVNDTKKNNQNIKKIKNRLLLTIKPRGLKK